MKKRIAFIDKEEQQALKTLIQTGKISEIVDLIEARLGAFLEGRELLMAYDKKGVNTALFDALRSLDKTANSTGYYLAKNKKPIISDKKSGRPLKKDSDIFFFSSLNILGLFIHSILLDSYKNGLSKPSKSSVIKIILKDEEMAYRTGLVDKKRTKRYELIDEACILLDGVPYSEINFPE